MDYKTFIVLIIASTLPLIVIASGQSTCEFQSSKPNRLMRSTGHSSDNLAVVSASAYLRYHHDATDTKSNSSESQYMPLLFKNYEFSPRDLFGHPILTLEADCAKLVLTFNEVGRDYDVYTIDVFLNVPNKDVSVCTITRPQITQEAKRHYSCDLSLSPRVCKAKVGGVKIDIVDVVFTKLEFEIFGSQIKTMYDEFTTRDTTC